MIEIDGSFGEGGGQILRTAVGLAALTETQLRIKNIRAGRQKPGLQNQHLCAVRSVSQICQGELEGDTLGSPTLVFAPQRIQGGDYELNIGTAGSATLVAQSVLFPLLTARTPSHVRIIGGTHNPMAPPFEFFDAVYLPQLRKMGIPVQSRLWKHGLYPKGGGEIEFSLYPTTSMRGLAIRELGKFRSARITALVANLPLHIAEREVDLIRRRCGWRQCETHAQEIANETGPGNIIVIEIKFDHALHVVIEFGKRGVRAEQVATRALRQAKSVIKAAVPVGEYLADQLLLPAAIAANYHGQSSQFLTTALSGHTTTHIWLLQQFLSIDVDWQADPKGNQLVTVQPN